MKYYDLIKQMQQDYDALPIFKAKQGKDFEMEFCNGLKKIKFGNYKNKQITKIAIDTYIPKEAICELQNWISYYTQQKNIIYDNQDALIELFDDAFIKCNYEGNNDMSLIYKYCFMDQKMINDDIRLKRAFDIVLCKYQ